MTSDPEARDAVSRATALVAEFGGGEAFGAIRAVRSEDVPEPARGLLDHRSHMTVAMERFHGTQVRLRVVATNERQGPGAGDAGGGDARRPGQRPWYAREILLETPDDRIVQHGIVRIDLEQIDPATAASIRAGRRPLGRILIAAGMLREVRDVRLLEVTPGPHLQTLLRLPSAGREPPSPLYGRVADIDLAGRPAVQLLEIVMPT